MPKHTVKSCNKGSHMGQRKSGLLIGSVHMKFSMTGQENCDHMGIFNVCKES
jgi:hypothetical protein